jgi:hypothetical protein
MTITITRKGLNVVSVVAMLIGLSWAIGTARAQGPGGVTAAATVGSQIGYQGLLQEGGVPVTGLRNMVFRLYSDDTCVAQVGPDMVQNNVPVEDGLFSVALDVVATSFNGQGLWLQVAVGGTTLGCEAILPVPYALGLRPGARVLGGVSGGSALFLHNTAGSSYTYGLYAEADSPDGTGVMGVSGTPVGSELNAAVVGSSAANSGVIGYSNGPSIPAASPPSRASTVATGRECMARTRARTRRCRDRAATMVRGWRAIPAAASGCTVRRAAPTAWAWWACRLGMPRGI